MWMEGMYPVRGVQHFVITWDWELLLFRSTSRRRSLALLEHPPRIRLATSFAAAAWVPSERIISLA